MAPLSGAQRDELERLLEPVVAGWPRVGAVRCAPGPDRSTPTRLRSLADYYPDGILGATREGVVTILNAQGAALLGVDAEEALGAAAGGGARLLDQDGRTWLTVNRPFDSHLDRRAACPSSRGSTPRARRCSPPPGWSATSRSAPVVGIAVGLRSGRGRARPRPRALRPRRHRRPRAALAADRRQGLRAGAAQPLGQAHRRPAQADADHGERRRRPAGPPHRRAPRRRPDRHRAAPAATRASPRRGARRAGWWARSRPAPRAPSRSRSRTSCRRCSPTPTSSPRS